MQGRRPALREPCARVTLAVKILACAALASTEALTARAGQVPSPASEARTTVVSAAPAGRALFARGDLIYWTAATGAALAVGTQDEWLRRRALAPGSAFQRRVSADIRTLGDGAVVIPALAAIYGAARLTHHRDAAAAVTRIGVSTVAAGAATVALKGLFGRSRPNEAPTDVDEFRPFSRRDAMPSGHTTLAFALARAVDRETDARWVPWIAYPAAALVGWSRVHDDDHWSSDVVAGAAVGLWVASKAERVLRHETGAPGRVGLRLTPGRAGIEFAFGSRR